MKRQALAGILTVGLLVAGCGQGAGRTDAIDKPLLSATKSSTSIPVPDPVLAAAKKEGPLVWYTSLSSGSVLAKKFEETYGIRVKAVVNAGATVQAQFNAETSAGNASADVVTSGDSSFAGANVANKTMLAARQVVTGFNDYYPERWMRNNGDSAIAAILPTGFAYNTKLVKESELPNSYVDLAGAAWKGKLINVTVDSSATATAFYKYVLDTFGAGVVKGLGANTKRYYPTNPALQQALAAGEGSLAINAVKSVVVKLAASGAPVRYVDLEQETGGETTTMLSAATKRPNAAAVFFAWWYSASGQTDIVKIINGVSPITMAGLPRGYQSPDLDAATSLAELRDHLGVT